MGAASSPTRARTNRQTLGRAALVLFGLALAALAVWFGATLAFPPAPAGLPTLTPIATAAPDTLIVEPSQSRGPISRLVYGTNYGPWLFVPLQVQGAVKEAGLGLLRFPGGNWGDQNDIDEWSLDQYVMYARQWGAEPFVHVRLNNGTPEKAAALVRYANLTKEYGIRYWAIGNEPNYFLQDTVVYNARWREFAAAMRAVDPDIVLVGPETDRFFLDPERRPKDANGLDWMEEFLKANGDLVDLVAFHLYPFPRSQTSGAPSIAELRENADDWTDIIRELRRVIRENTGRDIPVGVTEINSSWSANQGTEGSMDSHYNAIWWGAVFGSLIREKVEMVAQFAIIGEWGIVTKYEPLPIYYVYRMHRQFGNELVFASSGKPYLDVLAAKRPDGTLTIMIVNLASETQSATLSIRGWPGSTEAETWLFDAAHPAERITPTLLEAEGTVTVPPESITVFVLPPA